MPTTVRQSTYDPQPDDGRQSQALRLGLVDQIVMHVVPVVSGSGRPFFGALGPGDPIGLSDRSRGASRKPSRRLPDRVHRVRGGLRDPAHRIYQRALTAVTYIYEHGRWLSILDKGTLLELRTGSAT